MSNEQMIKKINEVLENIKNEDMIKAIENLFELKLSIQINDINAIKEDN